MLLQRQSDNTLSQDNFDKLIITWLSFMDRVSVQHNAFYELDIR